MQNVTLKIDGMTWWLCEKRDSRVERIGWCRTS